MLAEVIASLYWPMDSNVWGAQPPCNDPTDIDVISTGDFDSAEAEGSQSVNAHRSISSSPEISQCRYLIYQKEKYSGAP